MHFHIFLDNSNIWIEGQFVSAVKKGYAPNIQSAHVNNICDNSWAIDFGCLLYVVTEGELENVETAMLFGSKPTDNDTLWKSAEQSGFTVTNPQRNIANREKKVDTGVSVAISEVLFTTAHEGDVFILALGDCDYVPIVELIRKRKCKAVVAFWNHASGELVKAADEFINLANEIDRITYTK